jgi:dTDP-4-dehydrorhamnose 3,5-epimerase-like enzyme
MYIYTYISQFHKRGVIAEWVKAASDNQEVMSSNAVMNSMSFQGFKLITDLHGENTMN